MADSWVSVSPAGEQFTIQMPTSPLVKSEKNSFEQFKVDGHSYTATSEGVDYIVWSLVDEGSRSNGPLVRDLYLDACADLVWESLLKPLRDQLPKSLKPSSDMSYRGELESSRLPPGREYGIKLGNRSGVTHFHAAGQQIFVITVLNADADSAAAQRFINSFDLEIPGLPVAETKQYPILVPPIPPSRVGTGGEPVPRVIGELKLIPPSAREGTGGGIGPGRGENVGGGDRKIGGEPTTGAGGSTDYNRIFSPRDVTVKARVLTKPEPQYTDSARKYSVQGTVILRAVFSASGQVTNISVRKGLPHGLTQRAVSAARQIKFTPASKDGHAVSMYIQLEYNFNRY